MALNKPRRIIVCLDGTWETPQEKTNVYKFYIGIDTASDQHLYEYKSIYCSGLGTKGKNPFLGGFFGYGITSQIISAYQYICINYRDEKDEIWLIGFSRGAYTARSLVGMIYNVGLLPEVNLEHSREAYERYRDRFEYDHPNQIRSTQFREEYQCKMPSIHFLGCFDTVGALGVPKLPWYLGGSTLYGLFSSLHEFHDTKLSPIIKNAYHAISIHEQREWFRPTLMRFSSAANTDQQTLEQVWFPGMHGDVGGQESGDNLLSCHSLYWMISKARKNGLKFKTDMTDCSVNSQFSYHDSYVSSFVYKLMPRDDRVIQKNSMTDTYTITQIYKHGQFNDYITPEQLAMYKSNTLRTFLDHIIQQEKSQLGSL
ncbi:hypothetical protein EDC94DRAFT_693288 [Helicostylum pulchrum]|nr:hypothetical protein EDC94DRAFT_693288 [Helicostylum pulchrum]